MATVYPSQGSQKRLWPSSTPNRPSFLQSIYLSRLASRVWAHVCVAWQSHGQCAPILGRHSCAVASVGLEQDFDQIFVHQQMILAQQRNKNLFPSTRFWCAWSWQCWLYTIKSNLKPKHRKIFLFESLFDFSYSTRNVWSLQK